MSESRDDVRDENRNGNQNEDERDDEHLADVEPGAGCVEIWEHLTEYRDQAEK